MRGKGPVLWRSLSRRAWQKRDVFGGGEDAGVAGDSAHAAGGGVVDGAAEEVVVVGVGGGGAFVVVGGGGGGGDRWRGQTMSRGAGCRCGRWAVGRVRWRRRSGWWARRFAKGVVGRLPHAERIEDVVAGVDVERLAGKRLDEGAEGDEVDVGVFEGYAGRAVGDGGHGAAEAFGFVGCGEAPGVFEGDVFGEAGVVGEELADGDLGFPRCGLSEAWG